MNGSISDLSGAFAAALLGIPLVLLPGYVLGRATGILGFRTLPPGRAFLCAALLGIALLPVLDSLLVEAVGVTAAVLVNGALGLAGVVVAVRIGLGRVDRAALALAALWLVVVLYALIDLDTGSALYKPVTVIDLAKHAAVTRSIAENGVPPLDPFFARPGRAGYYYFFYTLCALLDRAGGALVDGRTAFAGLAFWTGIALVGLFDRLLAATGLVRDAAPRLVRAAVLLLLPAAGLDLLLVLRNRVDTGLWIPLPEWMNEQVLNWPSSLVWVPHHVAATLAAWLGLLVLAELADRDRPGRGAEAAAIGVAGTAFAACAGLSVWVCLGAVAATGAWSVWLAFERRLRDVGRIAAAGILAAILATPFLLGILSNRSGDGPLVVFAIRDFSPVSGVTDEPAGSLLRLILLPLNYYLAFGVFAAGAVLFWRIVPRREAHAREAGRLLTLGAAAALIVGGFLRSAILNNDLGWRVVLLAQVAALVWTVVALLRLVEAGRLRLPGLLLALLLAGYATTLYGFGGMRAYSASGYTTIAAINGRPDIDRDLRAAYGWAGAHLPHDLVLQQSPVPARALDFGLYGSHRVGVADREAQLFGASAEAVAARTALLVPIFAETLAASEVRRRAAEAGIAALVVTERDAPWQNPDSWVWRTRAIHTLPHVRILRVEDLDG